MKQEDKIIGQVYLTTDYGKFKFIEGNRSRAHAEKIKKSTEKIGQMMIPIIVDPQFNVIDGQGRLTAWKEMGLPIPYTVTSAATVTDIQTINNASTRWSTADFIGSYADMGNDDFKKLRDLIEEYKGRLPWAVVQTLAAGGMSGRKVVALKNGTYKVTRPIHEVKATLDTLARMTIPRSIRGRAAIYLYPVLAFCIESESVETRILLRQWESYAGIIESIVDTKAAAEAVEKVYNYKRPLSSHVYIAHLYRQETLRRCASGKPGGGNTSWDDE